MSLVSGVHLIPAAGHFVVEPAKEQELSDGGVILPEDTHQQLREMYVRVVAVSPLGELAPGTSERVPINVKVGDQLCVVRGVGVPVKIGGVKYLLLTENSVLFTVVGKD